MSLYISFLFFLTEECFAIKVWERIKDKGSRISTEE